MSSTSVELFLEQAPSEKRRLLQAVSKKPLGKAKSCAALFEPFEILRRSNRESFRKEKENAGSRCVSEIWLLG
jgi:hypothetical protein